MYRLMIRRIIAVVPTTPLKSLESFSQTPLKSLRFLSTPSEIKEKHVTAFFENHGFSNSQISVIFKKWPVVRSAKPEKTLLPKLLFFQSKGLSSPEIAKLLTSHPYILKRSLNKIIIPYFHYFQDLLQSEDKTIAVVKSYGGLLHRNLQISVRPNIQMLKQIGGSHTNIESILRHKPHTLSLTFIRFKGIVEEVKEMGFNPLQGSFVQAVSVLKSISKSTWKKKVEVYRKWGWTEEQVLSAFGRHTGCMMASEVKINGIMDYFVNEIGCESSFIARHPTLLTLSLKGRIVPRGSVYLVLLSHGLIKKHSYINYVFRSAEDIFLDKFIKPHETRIPRLLKLYNDNFEKI